MSTIYILWLRQLKKYLRSRSRVIGSLGQPILYLIALGFGFGPVFQRAGEGNYVLFLVPGVIAMSILFTSIFFGIELIWDKQFGFLKETLVAPVTRFNIMFGRTLGGATVATFQGIVVLFLSYIVGFRLESFADFWIAVLVMFLIAIFFTALGTLIATLLDNMQGFHLIMSFLVMPVFFLSGALFPLKDLPKALEIVTRIDPLTYGVDGLRGALINQAYIGLHLDFIVLIITSFVLVMIGSFLFSRMQVK